jgi:hypothetical protein
MTLPAVQQGKEALWLACKPKTCCYAPLVIPTGRDVWRIARTLDVPPWSFLIYFQSREPRRDAFLLDRSGTQFRLALAKGRRRRTTSPPPCIFLMRTRRGFHRCGLGQLRPGVCRAFPSELVDGVLCLRPDTGCTCRAWSLSDVDIGVEVALVDQRQADAEEYCAVVERWNEGVDGSDTGHDFVEYCAYLLDVYDGLGE